MDLGAPFQPFSESEKRFILAEAIKTSSIPLERILALLHEGNVAPSWTEMQIPHGRTVQMCVHAFEAMRSGQHVSFSIHPTASMSSAPNKRKSAPDPVDVFMPGPAPKRRQSGIETVSATARDIRPKPPPNGSPQSMTSLPTGQAKKRGRPSKADAERKQLEAIARGEVIPPLVAPKSGPTIGQLVGQPATGESGMTGSYTPIAPTPLTPKLFAPEPSSVAPAEKEEPGPLGGDSPSKKKRAPPRSKTPKQTPNPGESVFSVTPIIQSRPPAPLSTATEGMQAGPLAPPVESDIPGQSTFAGSREAPPSTEATTKPGITSN